MSVEEYLTAALKRVYVSDELPFEPELSYDEKLIIKMNMALI